MNKQQNLVLGLVIFYILLIWFSLGRFIILAFTGLLLVKEFCEIWLEKEKADEEEE